MDGRIALITGAAHGIGAALARRLAGLGTRVVLADVDTAAGTDLARELGGLFVHCDVSRPADSAHAVEAAVEAYGGLDLVALNAGVTSRCTAGDDFDAHRVRAAPAGGRTGEGGYVPPGRPPEPFHFPRVPGIRTPTSQRG